MITVHIENTVADFDDWKATFDKFDRFRREHAVRCYRVSRVVGDEDRVVVDLDFDALEEAESFRASLRRIWASPQSQGVLAGHVDATLLGVIESRTVTAAQSGAGLSP